jgi:hypothetical protein
MILLLALLACGEPAAPISPMHATWRRVDAPRLGLRCWRSLDIGHGVVFCEPDPTATYGASP